MGKKAVIALSLCLALGAVSGCTRDVPPEPQAPIVKYESVGASGVRAAATYAAAVRGRHETNMAFQVGGQIASRSVQLGEQVAAGQLLMTIDPRDVAQKANQGEAQLEAARAKLALAESNLKRYRALYEAEAIAAATLERFQTEYDAALAGWQAALSLAEQGRNALEYTQLCAHADGVIAALHAEPGQVVSAGMPVLTLVETDEWEAEFQVPENRRSEIAVGQEVAVSFWALGDLRTPGIIREIAPMADPIARTYRVRASLPAPPAETALGMTARVQIAAAAATEEAAALPLTALYQTGEAPQVWLIGEGERLELRSVTVIGYDDNKALVQGLQAGERVVTAGVHKFHAGQRVRLQEQEAKP